MCRTKDRDVLDRYVSFCKDLKDIFISFLFQQEANESRDLVDGGGAIPLERVAESPDGVQDGPLNTLLVHPRLKRRESVARMTWDGLSYLATAIVRLRPNGPEEENVRSRSVSQQAFAASANRVGGESSSRSAVASSQPLPPDVTMDTGGTANLGCVDVSLEDEVFFDTPPPAYEDVVDAAHIGPPPPTGPVHHREPEPRYIINSATRIFFRLEMKL